MYNAIEDELFFMNPKYFHKNAFALLLDLYERGYELDYIKRELLKIINYSQDFLDSYMKELRLLPDGRLVMIQNRGRTLFQVAKRIDGRYKRLGITKNKVLIKQLARKEFLRKETCLLNHNIQVLHRACEELMLIDPDMIIASMTKAYQVGADAL